MQIENVPLVGLCVVVGVRKLGHQVKYDLLQPPQDVLLLLVAVLLLLCLFVFYMIIGCSEVIFLAEIQVVLLADENLLDNLIEVDEEIRENIGRELTFLILGDGLCVLQHVFQLDCLLLHDFELLFESENEIYDEL